MRFAPNDDVRRPHKVAARLICGTGGTLGLFTDGGDHGIFCEIWSNLVVGDDQTVKHITLHLQIGDNTIKLYGDARLNAIRLLEKDFHWQGWLEGEKRLVWQAQLDAEKFAKRKRMRVRAEKNKTETV